MTDRLQQASDRVHLARMRLQRAGRRDLEDTYAPSGQSYEARVSGTTGTLVDPTDPDSERVALTPTEAATLQQARDHQLATRLMEQAAALLERGLERMGPPPVGGQCPTVARDPASGELVRCTGEIATHDGVCTTCAGDWRVRRRMTVPPDVIRQRNARRTVKCECQGTHDHPPGVCVRDLEPGQVDGVCRDCREYDRPETCTCGPDCCPAGCDRPQQHGRLHETCKKRRDRARTDGAHARP